MVKKKRIYLCPGCGAIRISAKKVHPPVWEYPSVPTKLVLELMNKSKILQALFGELDFIKYLCPECEAFINNNDDSFKKN